MGLQTLNKDVLKEVGHTFNKDKFEENMKVIKNNVSDTVRIHIDLIYGLPKTTLKDYMSTVDYAIDRR